MPVLKKMLIHIDKCNNPACKQIEVGEEFAYIGKEEEGQIIESPCAEAQHLKHKLWLLISSSFETFKYVWF